MSENPYYHVVVTQEHELRPDGSRVLLVENDPQARWTSQGIRRHEEVIELVRKIELGPGSEVWGGYYIIFIMLLLTGLGSMWTALKTVVSSGPAAAIPPGVVGFAFLAFCAGCYWIKRNEDREGRRARNYLLHTVRKDYLFLQAAQHVDPNFFNRLQHAAGPEPPQQLVLLNGNGDI